MNSLERPSVINEVPEQIQENPLTRFESTHTKQQKAIWQEMMRKLTHFDDESQKEQLLISEQFALSYAFCESLRLDFSQKEILSAWEELSKRGIWLAQTTEVDGMPVRIFSFLDQLRSVTLEKKSKRNHFKFYRLPPETFLFFAHSFEELLVREQEMKSDQMAFSATSFLAHLFSTSKESIRNGFRNRRPILFSKGISNEQKKVRQDGHLAVLNTLSDFASMTLWYASDPQNTHHSHARRLIQTLEQNPLFHIAPEMIDRLWLRDMLRLSAETSDPWYATIVQQTVDNLRGQENGKFLFASDVAPLFIPADDPVRMGAFFRLVQAFSEHVGKQVKLTAIDLPVLSSGYQLVEATLIARPLLYEVQCILQVSADVTETKKHTVKISVYYRSLQEPVVLFDVLDEEQVTESLRNSALRFVSTAVSRAITYSRESKFTNVESKQDHGIHVSFGEESKGLTRIPPKETKRSKKLKKSKDKHTSEVGEKYSASHAILPQLSQSEYDRIFKEIDSLYDKHIAQSINRDVLDYQKNQFGKIKILRHYTGPTNGHMLSLRCAGVYRMIFEVREGNELSFVSVTHRKELFQTLERFAEKRTR